MFSFSKASCAPRVVLGFFFAFAACTAVAVDMPAGYIRLSWIESDSAKQWIDTGYAPKSNTCIRASFRLGPRSGSWTSLFGVFNVNDDNNYGVNLRYNNDAATKLNGLFCNATYGQAQIACQAGTYYEVELKGDGLTVNGTTAAITTQPDKFSDFVAPIYVFCECNRSGSNLAARRHQALRLYSMEIVEIDPTTSNETVERNFIPCLNDLGKFGLWDSVEGVFYGNQASGADFTGAIAYTAQAGETLEIPSVSAPVELHGEDAATSGFEIGSVASGSVVYVLNSIKRVAIGAVGDGVTIDVQKLPDSNASVTLALPAGQMVEALSVAYGVVAYLESGSIGSLKGDGKVVVSGQVKYGAISSGLDVKIESTGSLTPLLGDVLPSVLGEHPALWLDASDETTFQEYTYNGHAVPEGTFPGIVARRWNDCRGGADRYYAVNARSSTGSSDGGFIRTMPYTITNELNGLTVLSFGTRGGSVSGAHDQITTAGAADNHTGSEQRRMVFDRPIASKNVIMVFGSQDGGGRGLIGGWKDSNYGEAKNPLAGESIEKSQQDTYYNRTNTTTNDTILAAGRSNVPFWVDGTAVVPNETVALNGGYQILSMGVAPGASPSVRSLGMDDTYQNAGGQRYGEILVFTNELTKVQRKAVELYLARKWGLMANYCAEARPKSLEIAEGGVFETVDSSVGAMHGAGAVTISGALAADGLFAGQVAVASGASLTIPAGRDAWTETQVDAVANRLARFDPDCEDDVGFNDNRDMVHALFGHGNKDLADTPYLHAYYSDANNDRRPTYARGARGFGPERGWMDLHADPQGRTQKGNNLRIKTDHSKWKGNDSGAVKLGVKTAFIVMDSCYGGGSPIIDAVSPGTLVKARTSYSDYTAPIWGSGTTSILTGGETRINGKAVNGTTTGFTGAPELFSFTTDGNAFDAGFFGFYNAGGGEHAYEVLGEIVLFSDVLDSETRGGIESYLMKKWLGTLPPGYVDWTGATVSGAGTVHASSQVNLPEFGDFSGVLDIEAETLTFTLDGETKTVAEAFDVGAATLKLVSVGTFALSFVDGKVKPGSYTLASFGTLAAPGIEGWTLLATTEDEKYNVSVKAENGRLVAEVVPRGLHIIVR